jgi:hypothetical protein
VILTRVRRYLFTHYTPEILLNPVFEDLRKPKVPNNYDPTKMSEWVDSCASEVEGVAGTRGGEGETRDGGVAEERMIDDLNNIVHYI